MTCRFCGASLTQTMIDLGSAPPSNAYLTEVALLRPEPWYPLRVMVCHGCWLVQVAATETPPELFDEHYAYFSSTSTSWLAHAARFAANAIDRLALTTRSRVMEVASNDGYLLRHFAEAGIPVLGVEPTASTAAAAERLGIPVLREFFNTTLARRLVADGYRADLVVANNVMAHVPDIADFARALQMVLAPMGCVSVEFPHLLELLRYNQFDTVYHEHYSYLSLETTADILAGAGLQVRDVELLPTHGGSLRVWAMHAEAPGAVSEHVGAVIAAERAGGLRSADTYAALQAKAEAVKDDLLLYLISQKRQGRRVAGYGAAAKGNTLLNFAGVRPDLLPYVCDASPSKQGKFLPGSRIPIYPPERLSEDRPDVVLVLPWNLLEEVRCFVRSTLPEAALVVGVPALREAE